MARNRVATSVPFELHELIAIVAVAEDESVSIAAERLHIAQPAVSRKVKRIENLLGLRLFRRAHSRMYLTPDGRRFVADARDIIELCALLQESMAAYAAAPAPPAEASAPADYVI